MGKHEAPVRRRSRTLAGVLALVLLLAAGATWAAINARQDPEGRGSAASGTSSSTSSTSVTSSSATSPSSTTTTDAGEAAARQALDACTAQVRAQERLAAAAAASARSWDTHTGAQLRLDRGSYSRAKAEAVWASTQARGPRDVREFAAATSAVKAAGPACGQVSAAAAGCARRSAALAAAGGAGAVVNAQWAAHLEMMADKPHTDRATYRDRWVRMVKAAQPALSAYQATVKKLSAAPPCG